MSTPTLLVRGASLLGGARADLLLADGLIREVGVLDAPSGAEVVDAEGLVALPGLVDLHTHLREPGKEEAETIASGSAAAAAGGYTCVHAMANTTPVCDTPERADWVRSQGARVGLVDVVPVSAVTTALAGEELVDVAAMHEHAGVRVFSDDGKAVASSALMRAALQAVASFGGVVSQHSQDPVLADMTCCCHEGEVSEQLGLRGWPEVAEEVVVARDVQLAQETRGRVHVAHVSTPGSLEVIRWAKARGIPVTAEVTPHHLLLTAELLLEGAAADPVYKVNPPLRPTTCATELRAALADGTIDVVATDHAPHPAPDKARPFAEAAFGMLGLETALPVVATVMVEPGLLTWADVARVMSVTPARIGGVPGHGRPLAAGEPAHLVLVDPAATTTVDREQSRSRSRNNPFHGRTLRGAVVATYFHGRRTGGQGRA